MSALKDRLHDALASSGLRNQSELAAKVGISRASVSDWFTGATQTIEGANLTKAAEALGVDPHWLATGEGTSSVQRVDQTLPEYGLAPVRTWEHETDLPPGEYAFIPRLDVHLSAGNGRDQRGHDPQVEIEFVKTQPQAFRADWIRKMCLKPAKLAVMHVTGDSMEDRLHEGDAVVIDTSQTDIVDGKVYALWYDGGERVKRLYRLPGGGLVIRSDNEGRHPPLTISAGDSALVRIIGRVVHVSGEGGL